MNLSQSKQREAGQSSKPSTLAVLQRGSWPWDEQIPELCASAGWKRWELPTMGCPSTAVKRGITQLQGQQCQLPS